MNKIKLKVWNRVVMSKSEIAAEIPASKDSLRRWIAIYPNVGKSIDKNVPPHEYSVLDFELDKLLMTEYVGDEDLIMVNKRRYYLNNEEELYHLLNKLNIDNELFDAPWNSNYPL